jgi:hypothetical protein
MVYVTCGRCVVALLCKIGALRSFTLDKMNYWRERASGMSSLAYFMSKDTIDHFNTIVKPIVYLSMFYFFNNPRSSIWENYVVLLALVYCVTGIGYTFAIFFQPGSAQLVSSYACSLDLVTISSLHASSWTRHMYLLHADAYFSAPACSGPRCSQLC